MYNVYEHRLVENAPISGAYNSPAWRVSRIFNCTFQALWSNGAGFVATGNIEVSLDGVNWDVLPGGALILSGASGSDTWSIIDIHQNYIRLALSGVSGTADLDVTVSGKGW